MIPFPETSFLTSASGVSGFPADTGREVAVAGRSNAGKSSAINAITGRRNLARTSKTPGRTQLVNFFRLDDARRIVDLPGYGYAKVSQSKRASWRMLVDRYIGARESLVGFVLVVDIRRGLTEGDRALLELADSDGLPVHVLLTKADKLKRRAASEARQRVLAESALPEENVQLFSALKRRGVDEVRSLLLSWLGDS